MNHNPFYSINTNLYDESFRSSAPTTLNGESVILSQEQQRRVCDTLNTSIVGCATNQPMLCAQKQFFPGGVLFTFPTGPSANQEQCCRCAMHQPQTSPQAAVQSFFPSSVEYLQMNPCGFQQPPREHFKLQFHRNSSTSSSDLLPKFPQVPAPTFSSPSPKSCQQCQTMQEIMFPSPPIDFSSKVNKLVLSKCPGPPKGHVVDVLDPSADEQKKVSFSDTKQPNTKEESIQMTSDCICDANKCKDKPKKSKRTARSPKERSRDWSSSESSSENQEQSRKVKKKRWRKRKKKSDSEGPSSEERQRSQKERPTKSKHNLKTEPSNELGSCLSSEELSLLLSSQSSKTSTGSEECYCP